MVRIKIRAEEFKDPKDKYRHVSGGSVRYFIFGDRTAKVWIVVETERDGALLWQQVRGLGIGVMGTGSASIRPDSIAADILRRAELVLVALDNDQAGAVNAHKFWLPEFPNALRWTVPKQYGKDPGDMVGKCELREWVLAGLPAHVRRKMKAKANILGWPEPDGTSSEDYKYWRGEAVALGVRLRLATGKPQPEYPTGLLARLKEREPDYPADRLEPEWRESFEIGFKEVLPEVERLLKTKGMGI